jgi:nicotinamidase-related amidase
VLDETLDEPFTQIKTKGAWTQTLWPPHCIQGTKSADFDPGLGLPQGLLDEMKAKDKAPDIHYYDPATGNHFNVIRKGMNSELDSYGIGIENDKRTRTTARNVFEKIADRFQENLVEKLHINIGGLASNFCMEFSHNNIVDEIVGMFRISGMKADVNIIHDISRGIPIPGGRDDPFSLDGAFERMKDYNHGETKSLTSRTLMLERGTPLPEIHGSLVAQGFMGQQQQGMQ